MNVTFELTQPVPSYLLYFAFDIESGRIKNLFVFKNKPE